MSINILLFDLCRVPVYNGSQFWTNTIIHITARAPTAIWWALWWDNRGGFDFTTQMVAHSMCAHGYITDKSTAAGITFGGIIDKALITLQIQYFSMSSIGGKNSVITFF